VTVAFFAAGVVLSTMKKRKVALASLVVACFAAGGIVKIKSALQRRSPAAVAIAPKAPRPFRPGRKGTIIVDAKNAATPERAAQAVRETLRTSPELLSTTAALPPFDQADFEANPKEYLAQVVPARCMQTAAPGAEVPALQMQSQGRAAIATGDVAPLWVKAVDGAPVTFTTFDGGSFKENGLTSVTVQANANGLAVAHYTAGPGIGGDVNIVAGSPLSSGTQHFFIRVGGTQAVAAAERNDK
jgi:hypothetical protein